MIAKCRILLNELSLGAKGTTEHFYVQLLLEHYMAPKSHCQEQSSLSFIKVERCTSRQSIYGIESGSLFANDWIIPTQISSGFLTSSKMKSHGFKSDQVEALLASLDVPPQAVLP